jgi:hypothetical protein
MQDHFDIASQTVSWSYYDFSALLAPGAPWRKASHLIDAMMFNVTHAAEGFRQHGVPSLRDIGETLARLRIKAGGGGAVVYTDGLCQGAGIEGMTNDKDFAREVFYATKTWHDAGMPMSYFVMDGPFYFGYEYSRDRCHFSIEDVARRAANTMKMIRGLYPNLVIVDAEGPGKDMPATWLPEYHRFLTAFRSALGAPIDYIDMDLHWTDTWHTGYSWVSVAKEIAVDLHAQGLRVSLIVNADDRLPDPDLPPPQGVPFKMTSSYWMKAVRKHIDLIKQSSIPLDALDLESWMMFPRYNLPESNPQAWVAAVRYAHDIVALPN